MKKIVATCILSLLAFSATAKELVTTKLTSSITLGAVSSFATDQDARQQHEILELYLRAGASPEELTSLVEQGFPEEVINGAKLMLLIRSLPLEKQKEFDELLSGVISAEESRLLIIREWVINAGFALIAVIAIFIILCINRLMLLNKPLNSGGET